MPIPLGILAVAGAGAGGGSPYDLLETTVLTGTTGSITFSNLDTYSSTYDHLQLRVTMRGDGDTFYFRFNGDTGNNYSRHDLFGNGSNVSSTASSSQDAGLLGVTVTLTSSTADVFGAAVIDILDVFGTKNKTVRTFSGRVAGTNRVSLASGAWFSTASVTSVTIFGPQFVAGSRFSLYGIK